MMSYNLTKIKPLANVNCTTNASNLTKIMSVVKVN